MKYLIIAISLFLFSGCIKEVKPWEKAKFSQKEMKFGGTNSLINKYNEHTYFSKEASSGGSGVSGGGCGCN